MALHYPDEEFERHEAYDGIVVPFCPECVAKGHHRKQTMQAQMRGRDCKVTAYSGKFQCCCYCDEHEAEGY